METSAYLFAHFKEKRTPDGEQVYFGLSRDGYHWEAVNGGEPVLTSGIGDGGVRDFCIYRTRENSFVLLATDLSLANHFHGKYQSDWDIVNQKGSPYLILWKSDDLVHWTEPRQVRVVDDSYGCAWAPDIIAIDGTDEYLVHWSSVKKGDEHRRMAIYAATTKDFVHYSEPFAFARKEGTQIIDSNVVYHDGWYYRFIKWNVGKGHVYMERGRTLLPKTGSGLSAENGWEQMPAFDAEMAKLEAGQYEAPTCFRMADGRWCLMLDFYGTKVPEEQGYVPFVADDIATGKFVRSDAEFSFPYKFKHGTVMPVTAEEYDRVKKAFG
ncbi:MAG: glycoside hydrolase family 43 protein [Lachnospiraceae bacterium]|jgi:hypothetical protein